jgi:hypothetical protein
VGGLKPREVAAIGKKGSMGAAFLPEFILAIGSISFMRAKRL